MVDKSKVKIPKFQPVDLANLPIKLPKIEVDSSKCTVPFWCKKCLEACPHLIFWVESLRDERLKETDPREPGLYRLFAVRRDKCTMCGKCVEVCPEGAITVTFEDTVLKGTKTADTVTEARNSPYPLIVAPSSYSFDLNEEMIALLRQECNPQKVVTKFADAIAGKKGLEIDDIAKEVFGEYGREWMKKVLQLGEEYPDRTYEVLKEVIDLTGDYSFPHVTQRFIEIAYLGTQQFLHLTVLENYPERLLYQVPDCYVYKLLQEKCGSEAANLMPCKNACLEALDTLRQDLELDVLIDMTASTAKDGYCEFSMKKL